MDTVVEPDYKKVVAMSNTIQLGEEEKGAANEGDMGSGVEWTVSKHFRSSSSFSESCSSEMLLPKLVMKHWERESFE